MSNKSHGGKQKRTITRKATMPGRNSPLAFAANLAFVPDTLKGDVALTTFDRKGRALGSFAMSAEAALELFDQLGEAIALITGSREHISGHRAKKLDAEFEGGA